MSVRTEPADILMVCLPGILVVAAIQNVAAQFQSRAVVLLPDGSGHHRQLLKEAWGGVAGAQPLYLRVYMARLRHMVEEDPSLPATSRPNPA